MPQQSFIHHPSTVPVKMVISDEQCPILDDNDELSTGVYIQTEQSYPVNSCVNVEINVQKPAFTAKGFVRCCQRLKGNKGYQIGIVFDCPETAFAVRMIEQVCHIEEYRQKVSLTQGRELSIDSAASEWITQHAADFPELNTI